MLREIQKYYYSSSGIFRICDNLSSSNICRMLFNQSLLNFTLCAFLFIWLVALRRGFRTAVSKVINPGHLMALVSSLTFLTELVVVSRCYVLLFKSLLTSSKLTNIAVPCNIFTSIVVSLMSIIALAVLFTVLRAITALFYSKNSERALSRLIFSYDFQLLFIIGVSGFLATPIILLSKGSWIFSFLVGLSIGIPGGLLLASLVSPGVQFWDYLVARFNSRDDVYAARVEDVAAEAEAPEAERTYKSRREGDPLMGEINRVTGRTE